MQVKILSKLLLIPILFFLYLYYSILFSNLKYEREKSHFNSGYHSDNGAQLLQVARPDEIKLAALQNLMSNPLQAELYLRASLINNSRGKQSDVEESRRLYQSLLKSRPTWPYLHSGLSQLDVITSVGLLKNIDTAIKFGPHEHKVINSIAEIVFYNWNNFSLSVQSRLLNFLSNQPENIVNKVIGISARFGRLYEFCDYLYDQYHKEFNSCKMNYWQPLLDA